MRNYIGAAAMALGFGSPRIDPSEYRRRVRVTYAPEIIFAEPRRATFISEKPMTKRQRRRLRGREKEARREAVKPKRWWAE